jgi:aromatic ring-opening dioxygenase catalytic subunit (LigB family)
MATAEVEIIYKSNVQGLEASVSKITDSNNAILKSTEDTTKKIADDFKKVGAASAAAFGSAQVRAALDQLNAESKQLTSSLSKLQEEYVLLIGSGNKASKAFKDNVAAQAQLKSQIAEVANQQRQLNEAYGQTDQKQKSLTGQLRALKQELSTLEQEGKDNTEQFQQLTLQAAKLEDQIGDTRERVRVLASDTFKFDAALGAVQGLASGFEVAQGAAALFGEENQDLQEAINKTTAAIAIANGVQQLANQITGQGATKLLLLSAAQKATAFATNLASNAFKTFRGALAATGVGALVVALGAVVAYWDDIKAAISGVSDEQEALNAKAAADVTAQQNKLDAITNQENILRLQGKTEEDILRLKIAQTDEVIAATEESIRQQQITLESQLEAERRNRKILAGLLQAATIPLQALIDGIDYVYEKFTGEKLIDFNVGDSVASTVFDPDEVAAEGQAAINEAQKQLEALKNQRAGFQLSIQQANKDAAQKNINAANDAAQKSRDAAKAAAEKEKEDRDKAREELRKAEEEAFLKSLTEQERVLNENNKTIAELERNFREARFKAGSQEAIAAEKQLSDAIAQIRAEEAKKIAELDKNDLQDAQDKALEAAKASADATLQQQIEALQKQQEIELTNADKLGADKKEITERYGKEIAALNEQLAQSEFNTKVNTLKALEIEEGSSLERRIELINLEAEKRREEARNNIKDAKELSAALELINAETNAAIREENKKTAQEQVDNFFNITNEVADIIGNLADLQKQQSENRITEIQAQSEAELEAINSSAESEIDKQRKREALELRTNRAIAAEKIKQAKLEKAISLFDIAINTAAAVSKAVAQSPLTFGLPWSAFALAQGAIQAGIVASKPLPKFKQGGIIGGKSHEAGGTVIEAEKGEFVVNKKSVSKHRDILEAMNRSSHDLNKLINERYIRPAILDYASKSKDGAVVVNASLNSKTMEKKLDRLNKTMASKNLVVNINGSDSRYSWRNN